MSRVFVAEARKCAIRKRDGKAGARELTFACWRDKAHRESYGVNRRASTVIPSGILCTASEKHRTRTVSPEHEQLHPSQHSNQSFSVSSACPGTTSNVADLSSMPLGPRMLTRYFPLCHRSLATISLVLPSDSMADIRFKVASRCSSNPACSQISRKAFCIGTESARTMARESMVKTLMRSYC